MTRRLVVVGGGISGLTAAFVAQAAGHQVTVLEAGDHWGGKVATSLLGHHPVDEGADAFLLRTPAARELCDELGIADLVHPTARPARVLLDGHLVAYPSGSVLGVPRLSDAAVAEQLLADGALSEAGLSAARHAAANPPPPLAGDASIGSVVRGHFGDEVADRLVHPLLGAISAGDPDRMSITATVPQLAALARDPRGMAAAMAASGPPTDGPVFAAPRGGMGSIVTALVERLRRGGAELRLNAPLESLDQLAVEGAEADGVVLATSTPSIENLVRQRSPETAELLSRIDHVSVAMCALVCERATLPDLSESTGFLVPRSAGLTLAATSFGSVKWPHWSDADQVVLRCSAGHRDDPVADQATDAELRAAIVADLAGILNCPIEPVASRITRWHGGFPQYDVGHLDLIDAADAALQRDLPRVRAIGMAFRGIGIPACIGQARLAVEALG
jgi:oxygen-dependent protoporphyrinogen oxidase